MMKGMSTVKVEPTLAKIFFILSLALFPLSVFAQNVDMAQPDDEVTTMSMLLYLHTLNGSVEREEKLAKQLKFMQKVRNLWAKEKFQELRHKSLKEIIETQIGHPLFASAVAFHNQRVEEVLANIGSYQIPDSKYETVLDILKRCVTFRAQLKNMSSAQIETIMNIPVVNSNQVFVDKFSPKGDLFVTADNGGSIKIWDLNSRQNIDSYEHGMYIWEVAFHPDEELIASADNGNHIQVRNILTHHAICSIDSPESIFSMIFLGKDLLISAGNGSNILVWDHQKCRLIQKMPLGTANTIVWGMAEYGSVLAAAMSEVTIKDGSGHNSISIWDPYSGKKLSTFLHSGKKLSTILLDPFSLLSKSRTQVEFSRDGHLITAPESSALEIFTNPFASADDVITLNDIRGVYGFDIGDSGKYLAVTSNGGTEIWDLKTYERYLKFDDQAGDQIKISANDDYVFISTTPNSFTMDIRKIQLHGDGPADLSLIYLADEMESGR